MFHAGPVKAVRARGPRHRGKHTVQADDFTHFRGRPLCGEMVEVEERSRRTRWAEGGRRIGGEAEAKVQSRGVYSGVVRGVDRSCEVCCAERDFERLASGIPVALGGAVGLARFGQRMGGAQEREPVCWRGGRWEGRVQGVRERVCVVKYF